MKRPVLNLADCKDCGICVEVCPEVFRRNPATGLIEVTEAPLFSETDVEEAISNCPCRCIEWEMDPTEAGTRGVGLARESNLE